ncbi:MAG: methionyl-tRNA formyltransferase [Sphingomonadales bacterium]
MFVTNFGLLQQRHKYKDVKIMRIVFFGTPAFAAHTLRKLKDSGKDIVAVVTAPDKPAGRGMHLHQSEVKKTAIELGLPVLQPERLKSEEFVTQMRQLNADLGIVIAFRMLPEIIWSMPRLGTFNLHASLLPHYRGAAPINHAIIQGETETGVTTFFLKHEIDTGDIMLQESVKIDADDNAGSLHDKLMLAGAALVLKTVNLVESGQTKGHPQILTGNEKPAPKIFRDFCRLSEQDSVFQNHNKVRGLSPYPAAWIEASQGPMKVYNTAPFNQDIIHVQESVIIHQNKLFFRCKDGWLELLKIQPAGKAVMTARDFINGQKNK